VFLEGTLVEQLRKLEALHAGTKVDGEREERRAWERIRARLEAAAAAIALMALSREGRAVPART
jgi:hypothetical protein